MNFIHYERWCVRSNMFRDNAVSLSGAVLLASLLPGHAAGAVPPSAAKIPVAAAPSTAQPIDLIAELTQPPYDTVAWPAAQPPAQLGQERSLQVSLEPIVQPLDVDETLSPDSLPHPQATLAKPPVQGIAQSFDPQRQQDLQLLPEQLLPEWIASRAEAVTFSVQPQPQPPQGDDIGELLSQVNTRPSDPRQDRFLQPQLDLPPREKPDADNPVQVEEGETPTPTDPTPSDPNALRFPVSKILVNGSTVFGAEDFAPIAQEVEGKEVTVEDLRRVADKITQLYLDKGYITSRAVLVDQPIADGTVQIQAIEGRLSEIKVEGNRRLSSGYIRRRVRLGASPPLRADRLEDQLRLLRADPLFKNVEASLRSGGRIGESILIVRVTEARPFVGSIGVDNYSPPSVGPDRLVVAAAVRNLTGIGDTFDVSHKRSTTGGSIIYDISYRTPVNPMNGTLQLRAIIDRNRVTQEPFDILNIRGETERYEISFRQPLVRTPREEFALSAGFSFKDGQTFIFDDPIPTPFGIGPDSEGVSRTSVFRFGQDYVKRDSQGAWALRSQLNFGVGLLDATINEAPIPDSRFFSWLGQVQRVQRIDSSQLLIIQADVQLTPHTLLPSEQFVIGGGQSLRGYRQNARSADNGFRFSVEDRITLERNEAGASILQLAPFFDMGSVWNHPDNPNTVADQRFLASIGLGLLWEPIPNLNLRLDYAIPFIDLDDRGENAQDDGFNFSASYRF